MYRKTRFIPKRGIRTFRDLEVYQKALEGSVLLVKNVIPELEESILKKDIMECALGIPKQIAEAHSYRFDEKGIKLLDQAMSDSNKMVVYLEQIRDIYGADKILIEELIRKYTFNRKKLFNLYNSWKKYK